MVESVNCAPELTYDKRSKDRSAGFRMVIGFAVKIMKLRLNGLIEASIFDNGKFFR